MGETEQAMKNVIAQKVRTQVSILMQEDEIDKLIIEEIKRFQEKGGPRHSEMRKWIEEEMKKNVRQMVVNELTKPEYMGTTFGPEPAEFFKEVIKEHASELVAAMFAQTLQEAKDSFVRAFQEKISRGY